MAWEAAKMRVEPDGDHEHHPCCQDRSRTMAHVAAVLIPAIVPIVMIMVGFREYMSDETNPLQVYLWLLLFFFILAMVVCGILLLETTNASSISEMVAQRWNKTSYLTLLMIATVSAFSSCFVILSALFRMAMLRLVPSEERLRDAYYWQPILGSLSPLISFTVLLFPLVVTKTASELQMIPRGVGVDLVGVKIVDHLSSTPTTALTDINAIDLASRTAYNLYTLPFLPCATLRSARAHKFLHFGVILTGVLLGWISIGGSLPILGKGASVMPHQSDWPPQWCWCRVWCRHNFFSQGMEANKQALVVATRIFRTLLLLDHTTLHEHCFQRNFNRLV